jgi:curved DNA-binding protein CbpA
MKDYYYFLGISQDASEEDIKKSYRKLSLKYHPDKNENDDFFADRFREIQEAYETLSDPVRRQAMIRIWKVIRKVSDIILRLP